MTDITKLTIQGQLTLLDTLIELIGNNLPGPVFDELEDDLDNVSNELIPSIRLAILRHEDDTRGDYNADSRRWFSQGCV